MFMKPVLIHIFFHQVVAMFLLAIKPMWFVVLALLCDHDCRSAVPVDNRGL